MRAGGPPRLFRILVILGAAALLPFGLVRGGHAPTTGDILALMPTYGLECFADTFDNEQDCSGYSEVPPYVRYARVTPVSEPDPLVGLNTSVPAAFGRLGYFMGAADLAFNKALHAEACGNAAAVSAFVDLVAGLNSANGGSVGPTTVGECSMTGSLDPPLEGNYYYYAVRSTTLPSAFATPTPTPSPTPTPTPTPKPTPTPTPKPTPTPTPTPRATPRPTVRPTGTPAATVPASASASESGSAVESASASESASEEPTATPEQSVAGETFVPEPTQAPGKPDGGTDSGWAGSVPAARDVSTDGANLGVSALVALLLLVLMGFIGELFNNTLETNYDRILAWWSKSRLGRIGRRFAGLFGGGA